MNFVKSAPLRIKTQYPTSIEVGKQNKRMFQKDVLFLFFRALRSEMRRRKRKKLENDLGRSDCCPRQLGISTSN